MERNKTDYVQGDKIRIIKEEKCTSGLETVNLKGMIGKVLENSLKDKIFIDVNGRLFLISKTSIELTEKNNSVNIPNRFFNQEFESIDSVILPSINSGVNIIQEIK